IWILTEKTRESAERNRQTFLVDQTASLHESPLACATAGRKAAIPERKFVQRNPGSLHFDLLFVATEMNHCPPQRFRADKNKLHRLKHLFSGGSISGLVHVDHHIRAVKGNNRWFAPCANKRQEMHSDVTEVNMQETRIGF